MAKPVKTTRRYDSPRRRAQAEATRREILAAAQRLFERRGYTATTMSAVAAEAGVALKTVYVAFATKSGLLRALWHLLLRGDEAGAPMDERPWYPELLAEPDPERRLRLLAATSRTVKERAAGTIEVIRSAAAVDADAAELWARIQTEFHGLHRPVVAGLAASGALRSGLSEAEAVDVAWTLNHPNVWRLFVVDRGWTPARYEEWLADALRAELLGIRPAG